LLLIGIKRDEGNILALNVVEFGIGEGYHLRLARLLRVLLNGFKAFSDFFRHRQCIDVAVDIAFALTQLARRQESSIIQHQQRPAFQVDFLLPPGHHPGY